MQREMHGKKMYEKFNCSAEKKIWCSLESKPAGSLGASKFRYCEIKKVDEKIQTISKSLIFLLEYLKIQYYSWVFHKNFLSNRHYVV